MAKIERIIEINTSPDKIWPLISLERNPEWYTAFREVVHTSKGIGVVGETIHIKGEVAGAKAD